MGQRSYIAFGKDGVYDLHYSHWGASGLKLQEKVDKDNPLGGDYDEPNYVNVMNAFLGEVQEDSDEDLNGEVVSNNSTTKIEPDPVKQNLTLNEVINESKGINALYFVEEIEGELFVEGYRSVRINGEPLFYSHPSRIDDSVKQKVYGMKKMSDEVEKEKGVCAKDLLKREILESCEEFGNKHVLAASPALDVKDYSDTRRFFTYSDSTRLFKDSTTRVRDLHPVKSWQTVPNEKAMKEGIKSIEAPFDVKNLSSVEVENENDERIVQLPIGSSGLSIRKKHCKFIDMPEDLSEIYLKWAESANNNSNKVYQCKKCGFLTQSTNVGDYNGYSCYNCGVTLDRSTRYNSIRPDSSNYLEDSDEDICSIKDVLNLDPSEVPNSEDHLNKIKDNLEASVSQEEMMSKAREMVLQYEKVFDTRISKEKKEDPTLI